MGTNGSRSARRERLYGAAAGALVVVGALATGARAASMDVTVRAPASLAVVAERVRDVEWPPLEDVMPAYRRTSGNRGPS